jgi:hypothetical protein
MDEEQAVSKEVLKEKFHTMDDNTQVNENGVKYAKLAIPSGLVDYVADHYGFLDLIEIHTIAIQILHVFSQIEKNGYKIALFKTGLDESGKEKAVGDMFRLDINDIIFKIRKAAAEKLMSEKEKKNESL